ncbi:MAG: hypothetical protein HN348_20360, partial [Proteobacteria bacterium]|nr:hypothetical protein [Pseudomonadota bacterium]
HAALPDGTEVAVKVQYPGVAQAIENDLANAETLVSAMSAVMPKADFSHFVEDIISRIAEECDYEAELQNQTDFARVWAGKDGIVIPRVYPEFCTKRVLVSEFIHALEWREMLQIASPRQKSEFGQTIFRFVFESLFCHHMFNGDPHPGNYMFYPDGRIAFIDYGCVQRYPAEQAQAFQDLRLSVLNRERGRPFRTLINKTFGIPDDVDEEMQQLLEDYMHLSFQPVTAPQPYRFERSYCTQLMNVGMEAKMMMTRKMLFGKKVNIFDNQNHGVAFLGRINFGLGSILANLGTEGDFHAMVAAMETS